MPTFQQLNDTFHRNCHSLLRLTPLVVMMMMVVVVVTLLGVVVVVMI
jgi:hypothetical protein